MQFCQHEDCPPVQATVRVNDQMYCRYHADRIRTSTVDGIQ